MQDAVLEAQLDLAARGHAGAAQVDVGEVHEAEGVRVRAEGGALALLRLVVVVVVVVCGGLGKQDGLQKVRLKYLWSRKKKGNCLVDSDICTQWRSVTYIFGYAQFSKKKLHAFCITMMIGCEPKLKSIQNLVLYILL